jgi:hypothetical protein
MTTLTNKIITVAILQIGEVWDSPDITRIFTDEKTALKHLPKGFKEITIDKDYGLYFEHESKRRWANIKTYEVER